MNQLVKIICYDYDIMYINTQERQGGIDVQITIDPRVKDNLNWLQLYRKQLEAEQIQRDNNPMLKQLYDEYQTYLKLSQDPNLNSRTS